MEKLVDRCKLQVNRGVGEQPKRIHQTVERSDGVVAVFPDLMWDRAQYGCPSWFGQKNIQNLGFLLFVQFRFKSRLFGLHVFSLCLSGSKFLINLRRQFCVRIVKIFRVRKIFRTLGFAGFTVFSLCFKLLFSNW